ncbi:hypothetical protein V8E36_003819 [Tilletia maclaganii]
MKRVHCYPPCPGTNCLRSSADLPASWTISCETLAAGLWSFQQLAATHGIVPAKVMRLLPRGFQLEQIVDLNYFAVCSILSCAEHSLPYAVAIAVAAFVQAAIPRIRLRGTGPASCPFARRSSRKSKACTSARLPNISELSLPTTPSRRDSSERSRRTTGPKFSPRSPRWKTMWLRRGPRPVRLCRWTQKSSGRGCTSWNLEEAKENLEHDIEEPRAGLAALPVRPSRRSICTAAVCICGEEPDADVSTTPAPTW